MTRSPLNRYSSRPRKPPDELAEQARALACLHFALAGSPRLIDPVLSNALAAKRRKSDRRLAPTYSTHGGSPAHPALCAAIASVARARALTIRANAAVAENRQLRDAVTSALDEARRSRDRLRAAVGRYAAHLKTSSVPVESLDDTASRPHSPTARRSSARRGPSRWSRRTRGGGRAQCTRPLNGGRGRRSPPRELDMAYRETAGIISFSTISYNSSVCPQ